MMTWRYVLLNRNGIIVTASALERLKYWSVDCQVSEWVVIWDTSGLQTREVLIRKLWFGLFLACKLVFQLSNYAASAVFVSDTSSAQIVTVSIYRCQRPVAFQLFNNGNDDIVPGLTSRSTWPMFMPKSAWWWKWLMPWTTRLTAAVALICFGVSYTLVK